MTIPPALRVLAAAGFAPSVIALYNLSFSKQEIFEQVLLNVGISFLGFLLTRKLIPILKPICLKRGLFGRDINKKGTEAGEKQIPESLGLAPGVVFLICLIVSQQLQSYDIWGIAAWLMQGARQEESSGWVPISESWLVDYNAALATICFMLFLGFADDVLDIPWRVKLMLPALASLPLVSAYGGGTGVALPLPLQSLGLPGYLELGALYKVYMVMLVVFCTNAINILAGVNGLEAGQTFVIACAVMFHNLWELAGHAGTQPNLRDGHLFSLFLMLPLAYVTLALLLFNWYPSQVFVGDTYTYFAGMAIAVAGILGHFSETLLLFLIPQVLNFAYSLPQLFKIVHCPRHRLPRYDVKTNLLHATPNWNLVNLMLHVFGPCTEQALCIRLLVFQVICCVAGLAARWSLTGIYKA